MPVGVVGGCVGHVKISHPGMGMRISRAGPSKPTDSDVLVACCLCSAGVVLFLASAYVSS